MAGRLEGKVAFVTGAARGQGRAHCVRLAEEGADIIAVDICGPVQTSKIAAASFEDLDETEALVGKTGRQIVARQCDVRDFDALKRIVDEGVDRFGRLDVVVANAGIVTAGLTWELTEEQWQTMIDVNLTGVWHTSKAAVPHMIAAGNGGSIIFTSSVAGYRGLLFEAHYTAAKHGIVGLCKTMALELGEHLIRVNTIHPNGVNTLMTTEPDLIPAMGSHPFGFHVVATAMPTGSQEPEDVAATVAWLASDDARFITGCQLPIGSGNQLL
ncbi:MAG: mycofactocin-coupled SDR family oxidoreductase [Acidobacteria bacterium]|nr:mycofactocin-coupled SDR family oxidoreductase [Acidobacteriota bacterium]